MNDQLQKALTDVINSAKDGVIQLASYTQSQLPDLMKQVLAWGIASNVLILILGIFLCSIMGLLLYLEITKKMDSDWLAPSIGGGVCLLFGLGFIFNGIYEIIKINVAPKLYLISYISTLVK